MNQTYSLNMIPGGNPLRVPVRQFDKGSRTITMTLWNGSGAFSVPAGSAVTVEGTKPDGKSFSSAASFSGASVSFTVTGADGRRGRRRSLSADRHQIRHHFRLRHLPSGGGAFGAAGESRPVRKRFSAASSS